MKGKMIPRVEQASSKREDRQDACPAGLQMSWGQALLFPTLNLLDSGLKTVGMMNFQAAQ